MARIIGIDFGMKRCGLSATDTLQIAVHPLAAVLREDLMIYFMDYLSKEEVELIVFGLPLHADGRPTQLKEEIDKFVGQLEKKYPNIPVAFQDESFTSAEASSILVRTQKKKVRKNKTKLDVLSAVLILQRYLKHI